MQQPLLCRRLRRIGIALSFLGTLSSVSLADSPYETKAGIAVTSRYTSALIRLLKNWTHRPKVEPLATYRTPEEDFYIGVGHALVIDAPIEKTKATLDDMDNFIHFYPGYKKIQVTKREKGFWESDWEQIVPVFFVPNIHFKLIHWTDSTPDKLVVRYQMKESDDLKSCDGVMVLEKRGGQTYFEEYVFADTDLGILKTLAPNQIWFDTVRDMHLSSIGLKLRTENPTWDFPKIRASAKEALPDAEVRQAIENRKPFPFLDK